MTGGLGTSLPVGAALSGWLPVINLSLLVHVLLVVGLASRVIMRRPPVGVALAWLVLISAVPYGGAAAYLLVGERRIGRRRAERLRGLQPEFAQLAARLIPTPPVPVDWSRQREPLRTLAQLGKHLAGSRAVRGSELELIGDTSEILRRIADDIDRAEQSVLVEFYIWNAGGLADEVLAALCRASARGVICLVLIDAIGGRPWWKGPQPSQLRAAGVDLRPALPVSPMRLLFGRNDLRLHRKIVVIDGRQAWTGSMNLVDPRFFKTDAGIGPWVDAMVRVEGAVVAPLAATMLGDWIVESGESLADLIARLEPEYPEPTGNADVQVIRSGPGQSGETLLQMIVHCVYAAERDLVLTTPYLIPDESLALALRAAAARGVSVRMILPEKVDSLLTRHACRAYFDDLLVAGVKIHLYHGGLLHTKSIRVDNDLCLFGTANLDLRSLWLNYEVSLFVYSDQFAADLARLHDSYLADSSVIDPHVWQNRPLRDRFVDNALRLVSPLL